MKSTDIAIYIPEEFSSEIISIINKGVKSSKLPEDTKKELECWWEAELEFVKTHQLNESN